MASPISISGLASGIDTESIISKMIEAKQVPITRLKNEQDLLSIKRDAYRDVNTQVLALQNEALNLRLDSTFITRTVASSDDGIVRATASLGTAKTNHRVKVLQLAQEASVSSNRYYSQASLIGSNTVGINQLGSTTALNAPGAGRLIGGVAVTDSTTLSDLGLSSDFSLKLDLDASGSRNPISITGLSGSSTVGQMMQAIRDQAGSAVKVQLVRDQSLGGKVIQIASGYVGVDVSVSGAVAESALGIQSGATASSGSTVALGSARQVAALDPLDVVTGTALVVSSNGRAGSLTGTVDLAAAAAGGDVMSMTLANLGITEFDGFTLDPDAGGATGNLTVLKEDGSTLSGSDTLADLIHAINLSAPDVTAQVVDGSGGAKYLQIIANEGGRDVTVSQTGATDGFLSKLLGLGGNNATSTNATTDSGDFTMIGNFYGRGSVAADERRVVSGTKDDYRGIGVTDLIDGVTLLGASVGNVFSAGSARIQINNSQNLAISDSTRTELYGVAGITSSSFATSLAVDPDGSGTAGLNRSIADLNAAGAFGLTAAITAGSFKVGDATLTLTQEDIDSGITLAEVVARINSAGQNTVVHYEDSTDRFIATASEYGADGTVSFGSYSGAAGESNILKTLGLTNAASSTAVSGGSDGGHIDSGAELDQAGFAIRPTSGTITINGISLSIDAQVDTLEDVIDKINNSAAGVTASIDPESKRFTLVQKVTDDTTANNIQLGSNSDTSNLLTVLRLLQGATGEGSVSSVESPKAKNNVGQARQEARVEVDGIVYTRKTNTIDDITSGMTYELLGTSSNTVTLTVEGDTEKAVDAIAQFIVEYNKTIKLLSPEAVSDEDKKYLEPVSDSERSSLTYTELIDRLDKYESLNKSEAIRKESNFKILLNQIQSIIGSRVQINGSTLQSLSDLGINSGDAGNPLTKDYTGVLVADSTDLDTIKAALQSNEKLTAALASDDVSVARLFNQNALSSTSVKGTLGFDEATDLANDISFEVYDGTNSATITIPAGSQSKSSILSLITTELQRKDLSDIMVSFDGTGHLQFKSEKSTGSAYMRILDLTAQSGSDRLSSRFGLSGGSFIGPEADQKAGASQKLYTSLRQSTGINGFLPQSISVGGKYGQGTIYDDMVNLQDRIDTMNDRLDEYETRLRNQFAAMESSISKLQEQQNSLSQYTGSASATKASS
ncbi:flagellar filament capping protein FliD [bacterium]|nr:flagellar filament capping protein FliD [bacterium]